MKFHRAWIGKNSQVNKYMSFIWNELLKMIEKK